MKSFLFVLMFAASSFAFWGDNTTGYRDTANIQAFRADSIKYTPWFRLASYLNVRADVMANDTSSAGFASDSLAFVWGIQTGHVTENSSNVRDTLPNKKLIVCDTLSRWKWRCADTLMQADTMGSFVSPYLLTDTVSLSGFATQSCNVSPEWDSWYRGFVKGLSGNKVSKFIKARMLFVRQEKNVN
jgi:hypothetical protein